MSRLSGKAYTLIVIMLVMPIIVLMSLSLNYYASKLLPILFSSVVFILAAIALTREIKKTRHQPVSSPSGHTGTGETACSDKFTSYLPIAGWIVGFGLGIYLLGFIIAMALFIGTYMKQHGSSWLGAIIAALVFSGIIHVVFNILLQSDLYRGLIPMYLDIKLQ